MARTARPGEREHDEATEHFVDHTGQQAIRYCARNRDATDKSPWPPTDYVKHPIFVFQVYTSVDLALDEPEETPESEIPARASAGHDPQTTRCARLVRRLCDVSDVQRPRPIFEIYVMRGAHVLDFVEHSRHERLHRLSLRAAGQRNVPLIPRLATSHNDPRKMGFLFGVDNDQGWCKANPVLYPAPLKWPAKTGPLWVQFDHRLPPSVTIMDREWQMRYYDKNEDDREWWDEQREMFVTRIQHRQTDSLNMTGRYFHSLYWLEDDDLDCGMDFGLPSRRHNTRSLPVDNMQTTLTQLGHAASTLSHEVAFATPTLESRNITVKQESSVSWKLFNNKPDAEPDIRYVVFVPSLVQPQQVLRDVAVTFTAQFLDHLTQDKTLELTFHSPSEPTDSSVLAGYNALQLPAHSIGILTDLQAPNSSENPEGHRSERRLHPIDISPRIRENDPRVSLRQPYTAFIIIVDRPDFASVPAIRFMLAGGGPYYDPPENERPPDYDIIPGADYHEIETWRTCKMEDVVKRLTLAQHPTKAYW